MNQREQNKQEKRERIVAAAIRIISKDGIEALTMRRLAEEADVSSRTPYNLFDSKTDILLAIMLQTIAPLENLDATQERGLAIELLLQRLEILLALDAKREAFFRSVHWSIMRSDDMESKLHGREKLNRFIADLVQNAFEQGELKPDCDTQALSLHMSILLASILGMWADSQLTLLDAVSHIRHAWTNSLRPHARGKALRYLRDNAGSSFLEEYPDQRGKVA